MWREFVHFGRLRLLASAAHFTGKSRKLLGVVKDGRRQRCPRSSPAGTVRPVHLVELEEVTDQQWAELIDGEIEPWGGDSAERMSWQPKEWYIAARGEDGTLIALAGAAAGAVDIENAGGFDVLGVGGVFVHASHRGRGLAMLVVRELLARARTDPASPERAMLFCRTLLTGLYEKLGFRQIEASVWAQQPEGRVEMPILAMWRPLSASDDPGLAPADPGWPPGRVDIRGLPF